MFSLARLAYCLSKLCLNYSLRGSSNNSEILVWYSSSSSSSSLSTHDPHSCHLRYFFPSSSSSSLTSNIIHLQAIFSKRDEWRICWIDFFYYNNNNMKNSNKSSFIIHNLVAHLFRINDIISSLSLIIIFVNPSTVSHSSNKNNSTKLIKKRVTRLKNENLTWKWIHFSI